MNWKLILWLAAGVAVGLSFAAYKATSDTPSHPT
jgi:sugar phosphate permease